LRKLKKLNKQNIKEGTRRKPVKRRAWKKPEDLLKEASEDTDVCYQRLKNFILKPEISPMSRAAQPRSQGFSLFVTGKAGKGPGTGRSSMYSDWSMTSTLLCK
jgi:hypothetical protein